ncbi:hypothetical protein ACVVCZ_005197 [Escherichia coli]|nr:hypothetical protein [Escherichia coli]
MRKKVRKSIIKPITKSITQTSREKPGMTRLAWGKPPEKVRKTKHNSRAKRNRYVMIDFYARNDQSKGADFHPCIL